VRRGRARIHASTSASIQHVLFGEMARGRGNFPARTHAQSVGAVTGTFLRTCALDRRTSEGGSASAASLAATIATPHSKRAVSCDGSLERPLRDGGLRVWSRPIEGVRSGFRFTPRVALVSLTGYVLPRPVGSGATTGLSSCLALSFGTPFAMFNPSCNRERTI